MAQLLVSESFDESAAITIQRIWRGFRQRSFLRPRYYSDSTDWGSTASTVSDVAVGAYSEIGVETIPDGCVRQALDSRACRTQPSGPVSTPISRL